MQTTAATGQDVASTSDIQESLSKKKLLPSRHFVDAGYIDAGLLVESAEKYKIELFGPPRLNSSWQKRTGGYDAARFQINWDTETAICPEGKQNSYWYAHQTNERYSRSIVTVRFKPQDCRQCPSRQKCVNSKSDAARSLNLPPRPLYEALEKTREKLSTGDGRREYQNRLESRERCRRRFVAEVSAVQDTGDCRKLISRK